MNVYVHVTTGFEEVEALTVVDLLRRADIPVSLVSLTGESMVTGSHDITVQTDILFEEADYDQCDMIVLPGGPGNERVMAHKGICSKIQEFADQSKWLAAICAGPMVYGSLGLLKGKRAVIFPGMEEHLKGAKVCYDSVMADGRIITARGPAKAMEFGLKLIEVIKGADKSQEIAVTLVVER